MTLYTLEYIFKMRQRTNLREQNRLQKSILKAQITWIKRCAVHSINTYL